MKRVLSLIIALAMVFCLLFTACAAQPSASPSEPLIGIAWCPDTDSEFFINVCRAIEAAGGSWVMLDQVRSPELSYDASGKLIDGVDETGVLAAAAAESVRRSTWHGSNADTAAGSVGLVIFSGGPDVSPSLFYKPEEWHGIEAERDYCAERDVSDYLTMSYCLDNDIPVIGFCRGMQMLSVISGAEIIQDLPTWFADMSLPYRYEHRNEPDSPDSYRDYASHSVHVVKGSLLYEMVQTEELTGCPSWHHQAVKSVDSTPLSVTGFTDTDGVSVIEAVERTDKSFAIGLQFHPEAAVVKHLDNAANQDDFMDYDTAISIFECLVQEAANHDFQNAA